MPDPDVPISRAATRGALLRSPAFLGHDTGGHPEGPRRIAAIEAELARQGLLEGRPNVPFGPAGLAALELVHDIRWLDALEEMALAGGGMVDDDTVVRADSWEVALLGAGAATAAVDAVLDGRAPSAFVLSRPPGHHATPTRGMGFCLLNNAAVAAAHARVRGLDRILILDWDVHHGNGTQDAFWDRADVFYASIHQSPLYPGTGAASERGAGDGAGFTLNVPLPAGSGDRAWLAALDESVLPIARAFRPDLVVVSAGFDAHAADPLASCRVSEAGFAAMAARVLELADESASGRLVAVLEGGYDPPALARSVSAVLRVFDREDGAGQTASVPAPADTSQFPAPGTAGDDRSAPTR
jgi:acetoin utilization deacetylase AcuC-like enzyme